MVLSKYHFHHSGSKYIERLESVRNLGGSIYGILSKNIEIKGLRACIIPATKSYFRFNTKNS